MLPVRPMARLKSRVRYASSERPGHTMTAQVKVVVVVPALETQEHPHSDPMRALTPVVSALRYALMRSRCRVRGSTRRQFLIPEAASAGAGVVVPLAADTQVLVETDALLVASLEHSAGACRNSPSAIITEICYYMHDPAPDADDLHLPYAVEAGSDGY